MEPEEISSIVFELDTQLMEDENGYKFGGFCMEAWKQAYRFYGDTQSWLFTFLNKDDP